MLTFHLSPNLGFTLTRFNQELNLQQSWYDFPRKKNARISTETEQLKHFIFSRNMKFKATRNITKEDDFFLPSFGRIIPFSVPFAKLGESNGKKRILSRLLLFPPPLCLRL